MTKKEKAVYVMSELTKIYPETPIPLDHGDAYTLLIAVLLSARHELADPGRAMEGSDG